MRAEATITTTGRREEGTAQSHRERDAASTMSAAAARRTKTTSAAPGDNAWSTLLGPPVPRKIAHARSGHRDARRGAASTISATDLLRLERGSYVDIHRHHRHQELERRGGTNSTLGNPATTSAKSAAEGAWIAHEKADS